MRKLLLAATILVIGAGCVPATPKVAIKAQQAGAWETTVADLTPCGHTDNDDASLATEDDLQALGLSAFMTQSYAVKRLCRDDADGRAVFILAKQATPTCADSCDDDAVGTIDLKTRALASGNVSHLGIYAEAYPDTCLVDHVEAGATPQQDRLFFYCGNGEAGGMIQWYVYDFASAKLSIAQDVVEGGGLNIEDAALYGQFHFQSKEIAWPK